jgi:predicted small integral membrane protein
MPPRDLRQVYERSSAVISYGSTGRFRQSEVIVTIRVSKLLLVMSMALLASLVSFGNLTDYGSNLAFVQHVFRMDTIFPGSAIGYRAITSPVIQNAGYVLIIALETVTAVCCWIGTFTMWRARRSDHSAFNRSKRWAIAGLTLGFLTWQVAFMSVGGEWFGMWMSTTWNGEESAFRFFATFALVLIFLSLRNDDIAE